MSDWKPPASGTPCWISILAKDVHRGECMHLLCYPTSTPLLRLNISFSATRTPLNSYGKPSNSYPPAAKKFYSSVFNWDFRAPEDMGKYSPDDIAFFTFTGCPGGGIRKVDEAEHTGAMNKGSVTLYLWVDDLTKFMDVSVFPTLQYGNQSTAAATSRSQSETDRTFLCIESQGCRWQGGLGDRAGIRPRPDAAL